MTKRKDEWVLVTSKSQVRIGDCLHWSDIPGSLAIVLGPGGTCPCGMSDGVTYELSDDPPATEWKYGNCLICDITRGVLMRLSDSQLTEDETTRELERVR